MLKDPTRRKLATGTEYKNGSESIKQKKIRKKKKTKVIRKIMNKI